MQYLILSKDDHRVIHISPDLAYQENGNYLICGGTLAVPPSICDMVELSEIPEYVEPERFCYVDGAFTVNDNYIDPEDEPLSPDDILSILDGEVQ